MYLKISYNCCRFGGVIVFFHRSIILQSGDEFSSSVYKTHLTWGVVYESQTNTHMLARTINLSLITLVFADKSDRNNSSIIKIYKLVHV